MRKLYALFAFVVLLAALFAACAPQPTPATLSPPSPVPIVSPAAKMVPLASAEDPAWQKVVETAKREGKLTIYSYNFVGDIGLALSRAFKERYGINVEIITGRGAEFTERVKMEKRAGRLVADMHDGNATNAKTMKKEGLTVSIVGELPVLREKGIWVADISDIDPQDKHLITFNFTTYSPYVNTKLIKPGEEPRVWKDLLDPKWAGKMLLSDPAASPLTYQVFVSLMREKVIDEEFLKALYKQDLRFVINLPDEGGILSRAERHLSIQGLDTVYSRFIAEGAPIKAVELSDGTVLGVVVVVTFEGNPHPNAAKVFTNWLLSTEGQTVYAKAANVASVRKDVPNFLPEAARITPRRPIVLTSEDTDEAGKLFRDRWLVKLWGR